MIAMLEQITNRGNGVYYAIHDAKSAQRVFGDGLLMRDNDYSGEANLDLVRELVAAGLDDDSDGRRQGLAELLEGLELAE